MSQKKKAKRKEKRIQISVISKVFRSCQFRREAQHGNISQVPDSQYRIRFNDVYYIVVVIDIS